ncbi:MAG: type I restriction endonuclease subunit M, partial [Marinospirillum sp.]|uniref:TaqI-like C-terminal specificity domain-containing protein n=1 Tax=Marinospirillum sp. TaxID=2183934 RepID=UPI0019DACEFC
VIDQATRDLLVQQDPASAEIIKPYIEGKDLKKWYTQTRNLWLIFTRRGTDIEKYPAVKGYLESYRDKLEPKPKDWSKEMEWPGRKAGAYKWFEIQDSIGYHDEFRKIKILWPDISSSNDFSMNADGSFLANTGYMLPKADWFFLGWLNSKVFKFLFEARSTSIRGGFYRYIRQNIEIIPVPPATPEQQQSIGQLAQQCQQLAEQRLQVSQYFTRRLLDDLCPANAAAQPSLNQKCQQWWQLDFKTLQDELKKSFKLKAKDTLIPVAERNSWQDYFTAEQQKICQLDQQIQTAEDQLNHAVNQLFGLTPSEVGRL